MVINIIENISECKRLWNKFSSDKSLWDLWDIVFSFYDDSIHKPYFMVMLDDKGEEKGLLPLWYDSVEKSYYFFGGTYPENRIFWFDLKYFKDFHDIIPRPCVLFDLNKSHVEPLLSTSPEFSDFFRESDYRYFLNLSGFKHDLKNYLNTFTKKHKKNFLYDLRQLEKHNYSLIWGKKENFDILVNFNVNRFGKDSDMSDPLFVKHMHSFISVLEAKGMLFTLSVKIGDKIEGIETACFYNGCYHVLNGGYNRSIKNIGKLLIFEHIKKAINMGAKEIDFLVGDTGWKVLWNFDKELCCTYRKRRQESL